jgi:hypothetical protein
MDVVDDQARALMQTAEKDAFFAAIGSVPPLRLMGTMLKQFGPFGMYRFVKDRGSMMQGATVARQSACESREVLKSLFAALDARLTECAWIAGDQPSIADFTVYHPLWLHVNCNRKPLAASAVVNRWFDAVTDIGHGRREEVSKSQVFDAAKNSEPRPLPASVEDLPMAIGSKIEVAPDDYGMVPVSATLAAVTESRIILARETQEFGVLHVHFPREGYKLTPA